jgi:hypothetical protein
LQHNSTVIYEHGHECANTPKRTVGNLNVCRSRTTACTNGCGTPATGWVDMSFICAFTPIQCFRCTVDEENPVWFQDCDCPCFNIFCDELEGCDFCTHEFEPMCTHCGWIKSLCECDEFGAYIPHSSTCQIIMPQKPEPYSSHAYIETKEQQIKMNVIHKVEHLSPL